MIRDWIAESRVAVEQLRLLVLKTAWLMDTVGNRGAHTEIQAIKIATPKVVQWILDRAIQAHGAGGLSQDFPLAASYAAHPARCASPTAPTRCTRTRWPGPRSAPEGARDDRHATPSDLRERVAGSSPSTTRRRPTGWSSCAPGTTPGWPGCTSREGHGGLGLPRALQAVVDAEFAAAGAPDNNPRRNGIGLGMAAPTILAFGTEEQKKRFLRPLWTGEEIWCQLFSEPGAGSDLAAVEHPRRPRGRRLGGQRPEGVDVERAQGPMAILVARTDPEVPKHAGLTYFLCDMDHPGVDVRPLRQITGEAEFNEVFLTDVHIPDSQRLGDEGEGWKVATATLNNERVAIGGGGGGRARAAWSASRQDLARAPRAPQRPGSTTS